MSFYVTGKINSIVYIMARPNFIHDKGHEVPNKHFILLDQDLFSITAFK